jgi:hypothetical protein
MIVKVLAGNDTLLEQEYYSVGGGFIEWKGYEPPKKNPPKYPFVTMKDLREHAENNKMTIAQVVLANEMSISGRSKEEIYAFVDKVTTAMNNIVKSGLSMPEDDVLPGPIKLHSKAATVYKRAMKEEFQSNRGNRHGSGIRSCRIGRKRTRPSRRHGADRRICRSAARHRLRPGCRRTQPSEGKDSRWHAGRRGRGLPVQTPCNAVRC